MIMRHWLLCSAVAFLLALGTPLAAGEAKAAAPAGEKAAPKKKAADPKAVEPKTQEPFHVWADRIHVIQDQNVARITGNATVIKGDMRIDADTIIADLEPGGNATQFRKMTATGNVRVNTVVPLAQRTTVRPPLQAVPEGRRAFGEKGVYDATTGIVVLTGTPEKRPVVFFAKDRAEADVVTYDRNKNLLTLDGKVQLTATIPAKEESPAPPAKESPAPAAK